MYTQIFLAGSEFCSTFAAFQRVADRVSRTRHQDPRGKSGYSEPEGFFMQQNEQGPTNKDR